MRHVLKFPGRSGQILVEEKPDRIVVCLELGKDGPLANAEQIMPKFLLPILEKYDSDPRPIAWKHEDSGSEVLIHGDANNSSFIAILK